MWKLVVARFGGAWCYRTGAGRVSGMEDTGSLAAENNPSRQLGELRQPAPLARRELVVLPVIVIVVLALLVLLRYQLVMRLSGFAEEDRSPQTPTNVSPREGSA